MCSKKTSTCVFVQRFAQESHCSEFIYAISNSKVFVIQLVLPRDLINARCKVKNCLLSWQCTSAPCSCWRGILKDKGNRSHEFAHLYHIKLYCWQKFGNTIQNQAEVINTSNHLLEVILVHVRISPCNTFTMCKTHIGMYSTQRIFKLYVLSASVCFVYVFQEEGATLILQVESI